MSAFKKIFLGVVTWAKAARRFSGCSSVLGGLLGLHHYLGESIVMNTIIDININVILLTG